MLEKASGEFLGWFHFRPPEGAGPNVAELGYRLRRSAWGKGYATEGSRALIRKGFAELGVRRVVASTMAVSVASRRVMEKSGPRFVRTFHQSWPDRVEGAEHADVEYALDMADWERQGAAGRQARAGHRPGQVGGGGLGRPLRVRLLEQVICRGANRRGVRR